MHFSEIRDEPLMNKQRREKWDKGAGEGEGKIHTNRSKACILNPLSSMFITPSDLTP